MEPSLHVADHVAVSGRRWEVRKFSDAAIQSAIDGALSGLPPDKTVAVVAYADGSGASLAVVGRIGDLWSVTAAVAKPFGGRLTAAAEIRFTFPP